MTIRAILLFLLGAWWHGGLVAQDPIHAPNVLIFKPGPEHRAPCEPSIAIDPNNAARMVAGAVLKHVFYSTDSGKTWQHDEMQSRYGVFGDPCIVADDQGRFHYFHLSDPSGKGWADPGILDRIVVQRSKKSLRGWSRGSYVGLNQQKDQDKEWAAFDASSRCLVVSWTEFDEYGSNRPECESRIRYAFSYDYGRRWSETHKIPWPGGNCIDDSETSEGAVPCFDAAGQAHVCWSQDGRLYHFTLPDPGTYNPDDPTEKHVITEICDSANWSFNIPGIYRANGMPVTCADRSNSPWRGTLYVNWCDQRNGTDDTDVWIARSTDGGASWSRPVRVNNDGPGKHQFFTWMAVDPATGHIYVVFYDRRHYDDERTDVFLAVSRDGGQTFENHRISESPFTPRADVFFGDYNNISAVNGVVRPIWTRMEDGRLSIWTALINLKEE